MQWRGHDGKISLNGCLSVIIPTLATALGEEGRKNKGLSERHKLKEKCLVSDLTYLEVCPSRFLSVINVPTFCPG